METYSYLCRENNKKIMELTYFYMFVSAVAFVGIILVNIAMYRHRKQGTTK